MKYAKINSQNEVLEFPVSLKNLVEEGVISSEEATKEELVASGVTEVGAINIQPPHNEYIQKLQAVLQSDGTWKEQWVQQETSDEYRANQTRKRATQVLKDRAVYLGYTDWTQMPDVVLGNKEAWAEYRQALRDVTAQEGFPWQVVWPSRPE